MALNGDKLGEDLYKALGMEEKLPDDNKQETLDAWKQLGKALVQHLKENLEVTVPTNKVITQVTGQAVGTPNTAPIGCEVD